MKNWKKILFALFAIVAFVVGGLIGAWIGTNKSVTSSNTQTEQVETPTEDEGNNDDSDGSGEEVYSNWVEVTWNGLTSFSGRYIWNDGTNTFYSKGSDQYVLDVEASTWSEMSWNGLTSFSGRYIWNDGTNIFYSYGTDQYVLDIESYTWNSVSWSGINLIASCFYGHNIWTDGVSFYLSGSYLQDGVSVYVHYVLDTTSHTGTSISFSGYSSFIGCNIWTDGVNLYCYMNIDGFGYQYVVDIDSYTCSEFTWCDSNVTVVSHVFNYEENYYCVSSGIGYFLNIETHSWTETTFFTGLVDSPVVYYIWTDGTNYYYSDGSAQYKLVIT